MPNAQGRPQAEACICTDPQRFLTREKTPVKGLGRQKGRQVVSELGKRKRIRVKKPKAHGGQEGWLA